MADSIFALAVVIITVGINQFTTVQHQSALANIKFTGA
jgi:hypothetical protein